MARYFKKDPSDVEDYTIDWSSDMDSSETLTTVTWTVPSGLTKLSEGISGALSTVRISGGVGNTEYTLAALATFSSGRVHERSIYIRVEDR